MKKRNSHDPLSSIPDSTPDNNLVFIRIKRVMFLTGVSRSSIYRAMREGTFPKPIKTDMGTTGWIESDVLGYMQRQIDACRGSDTDQTPGLA